MLLVHQAGTVKVGEVVRYTLTYTPSNDRILPTPSHLWLKVKNTCAIPLRAAWVHGPYALHVAAYPASFNPHHKVDNPNEDGVPEYEPMVKAGGSWSAKLLVPECIRQSGADLGRPRSQQAASEDKDKHSMTWIIEIASQILFSNSASVDFELLVGRDERSLDLGFAAVAGHGHGGPGRVAPLQSEQDRKEARNREHTQTNGVYSKAVRLIVEDTETLWDKPPLPSWDDELGGPNQDSPGATGTGNKTKAEKERKRRNVHLVVVTHGLHSNLGADMLFLKESIDATVAKAREDARQRKGSHRASEGTRQQTSKSDGDAASDAEGEQGLDDRETSTAPLSGGQEELSNAPEESDDEEETIVRGFPGNACRTENGIQYLGKRLAKYILRFTYPDQPFLPIKRNLTRRLTDTFTSEAAKVRRDGPSSHQGSSIHAGPPDEAGKAEDLPYRFTSISFVGHSLGGLIQTYAIAYIHKHSPTFFEHIKPVNFVCMASPMLGLSNENPMYVKFALDFGLVGRTGQDLGLTWRPPTIANKGWNAMIGGFSGNSQKNQGSDKKQEDPSAKPLLRILPTGPAHQVLRMFRNRTVYSNVVNDGIVPLRTSCLLFLDWRGLGRVEKARRENGLIGTMAEWGWAELTGANASTITPNVLAEQGWESEDDVHEQKAGGGQSDEVPLPAEDETAEDNKRSTNRISYENEDSPLPRSGSGDPSASNQQRSPEQEAKGMFDNFLDLFRSKTPDKPKPTPHTSKKTSKALRRAQTVYNASEDSSDNNTDDQKDGTTSNPTMRPQIPHLGHSNHAQRKRPAATRGDSLTNAQHDEFQAPPKTSIFESAGDVLHPPLPSRQWITDPSSRARTIFHDRVYHPEDIPPPPSKRANSRLNLSFSSADGSKSSNKADSTKSTSPDGAPTIKSQETANSADIGSMKVEEKIARAYHRDLSWRKVLVRLEPDAHNNMIVRRMFANAYGWPVVKHLCDTHFANTYSANTRDEDEPARERAKPMDAPVSAETGEQVENQTDSTVPARTQSETREARDELADLQRARERLHSSYSSSKRSITGLSRQESAEWDDSYFEGSDGEDSDAVDERNLVARIINPNPAPPRKSNAPPSPFLQTPNNTPIFTNNRRRRRSSANSYTDGHRGLAPISPTSTRSPKEPKTSTSSPPLHHHPDHIVFAKPTFDAADVENFPLASDQLVEEPRSIRTPSTPGSAVGDMGLRKSVEEQIVNAPASPTKARSRPASKDGGGGEQMPNGALD